MCSAHKPTYASRFQELKVKECLGLFEKSIMELLYKNSWQHLVNSFLYRRIFIIDPWKDPKFVGDSCLVVAL